MSEQNSYLTLSTAPKHEKLTTSSIITRVDGGSNVTLVTSPSLLHNVMQTTNEIGNTGGGTAKTTHSGDLHMLLKTVDKKVPLTTKQACVIPSKKHETFGLSPFIIYGCK